MKPEIGNVAPDFTLQDTEGKERSLHENIRKNNIVLLFFPLAFSSVCTEELCSVRDSMKLYNSLDATVIAISIDSFFCLKAFKKAQNLNFTLLSDFNKQISRKYNVFYDDYFGMKGVSKRAAFVIDKEGRVCFKEILEDSGKLPDFQAIRRSLNKITG